MLVEKMQRMIWQRKNRKNIYSTANYWDSKASELAGDAVSMWANNNLNALYHQEQLDIILSAIPDVSSKAILDLGCGTGRLSRWFAGRGAKVTGVDFSSGALEIARKMSSGNNPEYYCASMLDLTEKDRFDAIFCWGSIAIACKTPEDLRKVMGNLILALKSQGEVLLLEPIHRGFLHRVLDMSVMDFVSIMKECGFDIKFVKPLHFWPARLALAYFPMPKRVTHIIYNLGQALMKLPGLNRLGDYHAIHAVKRNN